MMEKELLFKAECYAIQGAIYEVYREKGSGFHESAAKMGSFQPKWGHSVILIIRAKLTSNISLKWMTRAELSTKI